MHTSRQPVTTSGLLALPFHSQPNNNQELISSGTKHHTFWSCITCRTAAFDHHLRAPLKVQPLARWALSGISFKKKLIFGGCAF
jgi:hypothetical protein